MKSIRPFQDAADAAIIKSFSQYCDSLNVPRPPSYFKVCQVLHFSEETKTIPLNKHICWQQVGGELGTNNTFYQV